MTINEKQNLQMTCKHYSVFCFDFLIIKYPFEALINLNTHHKD